MPRRWVKPLQISLQSLSAVPERVRRRFRVSAANSGANPRPRCVPQEALDFVRRLHEFFSTQHEFAFYGSSLFFAYDANCLPEAHLRCVGTILFRSIHASDIRDSDSIPMLIWSPFGPYQQW